MHEYISTKEASEKWNLSIRRIQILCTKERISGAEKHGKVWMIPSSSKKPCDQPPGKKVKKDLNVLSLFSGCGGMDLGFEGNFTVRKK